MTDSQLLFYTRVKGSQVRCFPNSSLFPHFVPSTHRILSWVQTSRSSEDEEENETLGKKIPVLTGVFLAGLLSLVKDTGSCSSYQSEKKCRSEEKKKTPNPMDMKGTIRGKDVISHKTLPSSLDTCSYGFLLVFEFLLLLSLFLSFYPLSLYFVPLNEWQRETPMTVCSLCWRAILLFILVIQ